MQPNASAAPVADSGLPSIAARPDGLADRFFDPAAGVKIPDLLKEFGELEAFKAGQELKQSLVPQKPEAYEVKPPADFQMPEGVVLNEKDPIVGAARAWAHANGLSQEQFSGLVALKAQEAAVQAKFDTDARQMFVTSLGQNGEARLSRLGTVVASMFGAETAEHVMSVAVTKPLVDFFERTLGDKIGSGAGAFGQNGRAAPQDSAESRIRAMYPTMKG